ncbi:AraC family transcriptional regulator of arabinose operon [Enterococcus sp. PF1-24]|uniref:AraC family transcriptional regulator n=1 Tax=unclassified Enterococcus TaxID=2608891 RepID=UPI002475B591|nr:MULTISPECIES: AraC family transcriptional regulator [unclassified Enterococcus]MDH6364285.1 AraC family transcriptional regulator of arabinose operon [Enterococcus sp. PFB1-1]MDH6401356.1 AraC family transcriptional regulator of arabinose operon [Enterococcus sp. PF1-24]
MNFIKKKDGFKDERHIIIPYESSNQLTPHPLISDTYLLELGYYPSAKYHYRERINGVNEYILIYCIDGKGIVELKDGQREELQRGDIFCIPKKTGHYYYSSEEDPWSILWMHFNTGFAEEFHLQDKKLIEVRSKEKNSLLQKHFIDLFSLGETINSFETIICMSQLLKLILAEIYFLKDHLPADQQNIYLTKSIRYMHEHIEEEISLNDLVSHLKISASYLSSLFKKYTGKSPIDYLIEMRVEQACKYLKLSHLKVYEISKKVGYQDPYYFSRIFKKLMGISPKEYRSKNQTSEQLQKLAFNEDMLD